MLAKRLQALGFLQWQKVDTNSPEHLHKIVVWLEDQKVRRYRIEERQTLRNTQSADWPKVFDHYCDDVGCPISGSQLEKIEWLVGHALWLELSDDYEEYRSAVEKKSRDKKEALKPSIKSSNPLDNLDFESEEFRTGVASIAKLLRVARHPDHLTTLEACSKLVRARVHPKNQPQNSQNQNQHTNQNQQNLRGQNQNQHQKPNFGNQNVETLSLKQQQRQRVDKTLDAMEVAPGFNLKDKFLENAAKALALLYIQDLRELQTKINETIVVVQSITANPKTDTRLGKVGK